MDRHEVPGASAEDIAAAHTLDVGVQDTFGVRYLTYWFDPEEESVFCLAEGPSAQAVEDVHREAHGLMATSIIEVQPGPIEAFLAPVPTHPVGQAYVDSAVRAVLFTDICGSTELTQTLGDVAGTALIREHDAIVRASLAQHDGREVKHLGDGIMASFRSVSSAVEAAIGVQRAMGDRNADAETPIDLRIGISAGEPISEGDDLFGATVQLAARLCACADTPGVAVSLAVRELCLGKRLQFDEGRSVEMKGFTQPVQTFGVRWS